MPSKGDMIDLVNGLCLIEDKIQAECAFDFMKDPKLSNVEALKVPMFYVWHKLGYGHTYTLSPRGANAYWLASFKFSQSVCVYCVRERFHTLICNSELAHQLLFGYCRGI